MNFNQLKRMCWKVCVTNIPLSVFIAFVSVTILYLEN